MNINRREALRLITKTTVISLLPLSACSEDKQLETGDGNDVDSEEFENNDANEPSGDNSPDQETETTIDQATGWAAGGTSSMREKESYPDPFWDIVSDCLLVGATTIGPCTVEEEFHREDVSEGWRGVPLRLGLKIMNEACSPIVGAKVKIWHTSHSGSYSGQTPNNAACLMEQDFASQNFFRGHQITDTNGVVFFDTCFPGWYRGRVIHIHFEVLIENTRAYASQLLFPEDIAQDICENHSEYRDFGIPDVNFSTDAVLDNISADKLDRNILHIEKMSDGVMLGTKVLTILS